MTATHAFGPDTTTPPVEQNIVVDMIKRSVWIVPVLLMIGAIFGGADGATSTAFAVAVVLANFGLSAVMLSQAARISYAALGIAALFGFLLRLGLITIAVLLVKDQPWVNIVILAVMIVVTHLVLLIWELRYVSLSLSSPGVRERAPRKTKATRNHADTNSNSVHPVNPVPVKE